jgi:acetyl esterase/lipase
MTASDLHAVRRQQLYELLGPLPPRDRPIDGEVIRTSVQGGYQLDHLLLDLNEDEPVPAYFVKPVDAQGKLPTVLYCHAHGGDYVLGKDELIRGRSALVDPPYAQALTVAGYAVLCIDFPIFGERRGLSESEAFKLELWRGRVLWGMMVYDHLKAIDYLCGRPDVDANRLAAIGISMGSTMSIWLGALDPRLKVIVDLCCLTDFDALIETRQLDGHGLYYYVPGLLQHFSMGDINALISPRPHLSVAGNHDLLTPPAGLQRIDDHLRQVYADAGAAAAWRLQRNNTGHFESEHVRADVLAFLGDQL